MNDTTTVIESKLKSGEINSLSTEFNGVDEIVTVSNSLSLQPGLLDFSFLIRFTQKTLINIAALFGFDNGTEHLLFTWDNGRPSFNFDDGTNSFITTAGAQFVTLDQYFTLGFSCDRNGNIKSFVDGVQYISESFNPAVAFDMLFSDGLVIGDDHHGLIDELIFWKGIAMTDNEMQKLLYNNGHAIEPRDTKFYDVGPDQVLKAVKVSRGGYLAAHYKMGDADQSPFIRDHAGDNLHGTMINMDQSNFKPISSP